MFDIKCVIFNVSELDKIDFSQVLESSADTLRRTIDGTRTFVKFKGDVPSCVESLTTKSDYYSLEEILRILDGPDWVNLIIV